jgi:hypothetical protein
MSFKGGEMGTSESKKLLKVLKDLPGIDPRIKKTEEKGGKIFVGTSKGEVVLSISDTK